MSPAAPQPTAQAEPVAAPPGASIARLCRSVGGIAPATTIAEVADLIRRPEYAGLLCLSVVDRGQPVGTISRNQLTDIFMLGVGRELHGSRPVTEVMNRKPLLVEEGRPLEDAAQYGAANIGTPISEDFVVTRQGRYLGVGVVID